MTRLFFLLGSISAFIGVALGAFAAHGLKQKLAPDLLTVWETAVRYQMYHALALLGVGWACSHFPASSTSFSGWFFVAGTLLFSGSLYAMSLTGIRWLGMITPLGGLCFLLGWVWLIWTISRSAS